MQEILDMPMDAVLSSIFFLWNLGLDLSKTMMNYLDKEQTQALTQYLNFSTKWGWYNSIYGLAQGDITRYEDITKLGVHECFMMLSFMKDKAEVEAKRIKQNFK